MIPVEAGTIAVIFSSVRRAQGEDDGYDEMAARMDDLARSQPGFVGVESARDAETAFGVTVSYWRDEASAQAWKAVAEHRVAQERGRTQWYREYSVVVAEVTRAYGRQAEPLSPTSRARRV